MGVNRGKQFEDQIQTAFERVPLAECTRLIDPQNGYKGVRNKCDFIIYKYPLQYNIECKSGYGNTLSIYSNNPEHRYGAITNTQWEGLLASSKIPGIVAGYFIWFIDHDVTVYVPATLMAELRDAGQKSFHINDVSKYADRVLIIYGVKKRILFDYDLGLFVKECEACHR